MNDVFANQASQVKMVQLDPENERYKSLLQLVNDSIVVLDLKTAQVLEFSDLACQLLGYSGAEFAQLSLFDWDKTTTLADYHLLVEQLTPQASQLERVHTRKDGSTYPVRLNAKRVWLHDEEVLYLSMTDLTKEKALQQRLCKEQHFSSTIVNTANAIIAVVKLDGTMIRLNDYGQKFVGYTEAEVASEPYFWVRFLPSEIKDSVCEIVAKARMGDMVTSYNNAWLHHSGQERMIEWTNTLLHDDDEGFEGIFTIGIDVEDKYQLQQKYYRSLDKYHQSLEVLKEAEEIANLGLWQLDVGTGESTWNAKLFELLDLSPETFIPSFEGFLDFVHPQDREALRAEFNASIEEKRAYYITHRAQTATQREIYLVEHGHHQFNHHGDWIRSVGTVQDITHLMEVNQQLTVANTVIENAINGVMIVEADSRITQVNQAMLDMTQFSRQELIGSTPEIFRSDLHSADFYQDMSASLKAKGRWDGKIRNQRKDGSIFTALLNISVVYNHEQQIQYYAAIYSDITDIEESRDKLKFLAHHDALTGLPNRFGLMEHLEYAIHAAQRSQKKLAVIFFDIDRFKQINDTFGHPQGDELLIQVADRINQSSRAGDFLARLGGDEFVMLIENLDDAGLVGYVANKILKAFQGPFQLDDHLEVTVATSIGVALYPQDGLTVTELLSNADSAMYAAKSLGGGRYEFYAPSMTEQVKHKLGIENGLRSAQERNELYLVYQPQVDLLTQKTQSVEALLRWKSADLGQVSPADFIPIAEETGLIFQLNEWLIDEVFSQAISWLQKGVYFGRICINLASIQFKNGNLPELLAAKLAQYDLSAKYFELEITEIVFVKNVKQVVRQLEALQTLGFMVSLDDFGNGVSSLGALKKMPIHKLKIDRNFIHNVSTDPDNMAITEAMIGMAQALGLSLVAEGVETDSQAAFLLEHDCPLAQGYFFSEPLVAEHIEAYLLER